MKPLAKAALAYLQSHDQVVTALMEGRHALAFDLQEHEETLRREMADAIIRADPQLENEVRKVCKFAADEAGSGSIIGVGLMDA